MPVKHNGLLLSKTTYGFLISLLILLAWRTSISALTAKNTQPLVTEFQPFVYRNQQGEVLPYRLLKPYNYQPGEEYPLLLYLHGSAQRGSDNAKQLKYVTNFFERADLRQEYPCFVLVPQCPAGQNWVYKESYWGTIKQSESMTMPLRLTMDIIAGLQKDYNIDSNRIYIAGVSSGGSGTWDAITRFPDFFAAAIPMCGCGDATKAPLITGLPVWVFHGGLDLAVNRNCSRLMVKAIKKSGGNPIYTEYPTLGHDCWERAFQDVNLYKWLFAQVRAANH